MSRLTIYHNPRCSKSRQTLELIEAAGAEVDVIRYLETPLDSSTISQLLEMLGLSPRELMRTKEAVYSELGLADEALSDDALIAAIVDNPILLERPIVTSGDQAVIGRPPENVNTLL